MIEKIVEFSLQQILNEGFTEFIHPYNDKPVICGGYKLFHNKEKFVVFSHTILRNYYVLEHYFVDENYKTFRFDIKIR